MDAGPAVLDLHRFYQIDVTDDLLESRTWQWLLGRCYSLLDLDSFTRKEARRVV